MDDQNLRLRLDGVPELDAKAQRDFEQITQTWYFDIFVHGETGNIEEDKNGPPNLRRRHLRLNGITNFVTEVSFQSQHSTRNGTVISYDQYLSFDQEDGYAKVDPLAVLMLPFNHDLLRERFVDELRAGNEVFQSIPDRAIVMPDSDFVGADDYGSASGSGGSNDTMLIAALLSAVVFVSAVLIIVCVRRWRRRKLAKKLAKNGTTLTRTQSATLSNPRFLLTRSSSSFGPDELQDEPDSAVFQMEGSPGLVDRNRDIYRDVGVDRYFTTSSEVSSERFRDDSELSSNRDSALDAQSRFAEFQADFSTELSCNSEAWKEDAEPSVEIFPIDHRGSRRN